MLHRNSPSMKFPLKDDARLGKAGLMPLQECQQGRYHVNIRARRTVAHESQPLGSSMLSCLMQAILERLSLSAVKTHSGCHDASMPEPTLQVCLGLLCIIYVLI